MSARYLAISIASATSSVVVIPYISLTFWMAAFLSSSLSRLLIAWCDRQTLLRVDSKGMPNLSAAISNIPTNLTNTS